MDNFMNKSALGIVAMTALLLGTPVLAADLAVKAPSPSAAPVFSWTGFYVGLDGGGAWARQNVSDVACAVCNTFPASGALKGSGFIGGFYGGYNFSIAPAWIIGVEGDWSWAQLNNTATAPQVNAGGVLALPQINSWSRDTKWLASVRGRLGVTPSPTTLLYVTGGPAWSRTDYSAQDIFVNGCPNCALTAVNQTNAGYVVGAGGEWAPWSNNWILRAEYLYYHFNGANSTVGIVGTPALPVTFNWSDLSIHELRGGLSYKF
jgi:outer membrane immunogenic protein